MLESVQKFACRICLKQCNMNYDNMLQMLNIPAMSNCGKYLKLATMYNSDSNNYCFPSGDFARHISLYHSHQDVCVNFVSPFVHIQYLYSSLKH